MEPAAGLSLEAYAEPALLTARTPEVLEILES